MKNEKWDFTETSVEIFDSLRKDIYEKSVLALRMRLQERPTDAWSLRPLLRSGYYAFDNAEFARSVLTAAMQETPSKGARKEGASVSSKPLEKLVFPAMILEYTQAVRDTELADKTIDAVEKIMSFFLFGKGSEETEYDVFENALLSWACENTAELYAVLGDFVRAEDYRNETQKRNQWLVQRFFDKERGLFKGETRRADARTNALCILCGACPKDAERELAEKLANGLGNEAESALGNDVFRFDALLQVDEKRYAPYVLAEIDALYGYISERESAKPDVQSVFPAYYYQILGVVNEKKKKLSAAFALRDNVMRTAYRESIERYVATRGEELETERERSLYRTETEKREDLCRILGEPLCGDYSKNVDLLKSEMVVKTSKWIVERYVFTVLSGIEFAGFVYRLADDFTENKALVYCLHGGGGTPEIVGDLFHDSANYNHMVRRVLRKGTVVFAPQLWLWNEERYGDAGDRAYVNRRLVQQGGSITGLELFCLMRTLDWFSAQTEIDEKRIGVVGLSYGGMYALHFGALDTRVKAVVSDCWFNDRRVHNWHDWTYFEAEKRMMDAEVTSLVFPRKLYIEIGNKDETFCVDTALRERDKLFAYAEKTGCTDKLSFVIFDGTHEFNMQDDTIETFLQDLKI